MTTTSGRPDSGLPRSAGVDGPLSSALVGTRRFFTKAGVSPDQRAMFLEGGRSGDVFYRDRWSHDKVVRSTHGVNCTGSCSWKVYVKDGIITWEAQQTDYPSTGADRPEYEPRGCPRGAAFSWYTYSPTRVRYPYARTQLLELYRRAKATYGDPVVAWGAIVQDEEASRSYKQARGKGGLVRTSWEEAIEMIAAAHVYTIKRWGPDRIAGFSPIPAMSQVSYASGARYHELIGAPMLSFYDWYADLPPASPEMFGDQTDVPESGDWWDAGYLMMWGSNVPLTRTPDAHWMTEARYRGQKVIAISPDYAENVKFADEWVSSAPGTDGALAMAMAHVVLKEYFVDRQVDFFTEYNQRFTDAPYLVALDETDEGGHRPGKFVVAGDLEHPESGSEHAMWKPAVIDEATGEVVIPGGSIGHRFGSEEGRWNLDLGDVRPRLTLYDDPQATESVQVSFPRFDNVEGALGRERRGVPVRRVGGRLVTTVLDLMLAHYGVAREGLPGTWPRDYHDPSVPATPAWGAEIAGVPPQQIVRIAREWAQNAIDTEGRGMIIMGAGVNHWFHADQAYRTMMVLTTITGCQGRNGGGWAHYVGQEKVRPLMGFQQMAFALDWVRPPRHMNQTSYWYVNTSQYRYDTFTAEEINGSPGAFPGKTTMDLFAQAVRLGWAPSYPQFDRSSLAVADEASEAGMTVGDYVARSLKEGSLTFAVEAPEDPDNFPRVLSLWRSNLFGSSAKGNEYFLKHLLGTDNAVRASQAPEDMRPTDVAWPEEAPEGKLDLLMTIDFRMTSSTILSDVVLPAATWYEKYDLNTTDMHPYINSFNPAIAPPWQSKNDWDAWKIIAARFSEMAEDHLGTRTDVVAKPLWHDTAEAMASVHGRVLDWKDGDVEPVPGKTLPVLAVVERDYPAIHAKMTAVGPLLEDLGMVTKGVRYDPTREVEELRRTNGAVTRGPAKGQPRLETDVHVAEAILRLSGTSNGRLATEGFRDLERQTGQEMRDMAAEQEGRKISFADTQQAPTPVITSPEWSGSEAGGRRYAPFTQNIERLKPFHTLTGRQQFYLDHDWILGMGEELPTYRPPLNMTRLFGEREIGDTRREDQQEISVAVRYLTPHNKWSIHSEYQDNLFMLSLSRGGQAIWLSDKDAAKAGIRDNDWIEAVNRNGVVACRAIVSHRMPEGTVYMHHAQDRLIDVPLTETSGTRGGIHNSLTRILMKPSHLIGGYAQLSYFFNYIGPTGNNRDEVTTIRKRSNQEVTY
ncbi:nitrate reductase subunit alpha [Janibacter corallicola]|uniref:nitrate reductase subunit alpha n=1 Tax=Janibacter corallicola TaxID=415212 RepID=UPI00082C5847|nr:nitrate reductase subunit alpha [Janibacter corallicola]